MPVKTHAENSTGESSDMSTRHGRMEVAKTSPSSSQAPLQIVEIGDRMYSLQTKIQNIKSFSCKDEIPK